MKTELDLVRWDRFRSRQSVPTAGHRSDALKPLSFLRSGYQCSTASPPGHTAESPAKSQGDASEGESSRDVALLAQFEAGSISVVPFLVKHSHIYSQQVRSETSPLPPSL